MSNYESIFTESERQIRHYLAPLMHYYDSPLVNEIMINRFDRIFVEEAGRIHQIPVEIDDSMVEAAIKAVMSMNRKDAAPLMDARLKGMRVAAVLPPIAVHGPVMAIRKLSTSHQTLQDYLARGDFDQVDGSTDRDGVDPKERADAELAAAHGGQGLLEFFKWMMHKRQDAGVCGGTSSGKTTIGGALLDCIPDDHRIITNEDTNELSLKQPNVVQLEANIQFAVTLRMLIKMCLRLRPDRIIVGEVRGPELFDLMDAMNTGHPGTLFTIHANGPFECLSRMETLLRMAPEMAQASTLDIRQKITGSLHYVVFQGKRGKVRAPEQVIALGDTLDANGNYRIRQIYNRQIPNLSSTATESKQ